VRNTRPVAVLVAAFVAALVVGATVTLVVTSAANPHLVLGVGAVTLVGLVCVAGARSATVTRTAYW
jgi:hypothetical protein